MKKLNFTFAVFALLVTSSIFANDILSHTKKDILNYSYEKSKEDSSKLKNDWINPITYKFIYNQGDEYTTSKSFISVSQPIFKSGGIYYAIKYANSMEKLGKTTIDTQKKELVKQALNLLFEINKIDITIEKQKLLIRNAKLDIDRKKEQVLNGILDTSFLDNAIIESNMKENSLIDLEYQKYSLINNLSKISNKSYHELELPTFSLLDESAYIENNIYLKQVKEDIDSSYWMKNMVTSNYLPTINLTADYTKYHETDDMTSLQGEDTFKNIGFNITIPLDIKYSYNIASYKLAYLQKKLTLEDTKQDELLKFKSLIQKIASLDKKIEIAKKDVYLYDSLLTQMIEQQTVGMKTQSDVDTMINSKDIKKLDIKSLNIDKQIELLEIYSRTIDG
ncbi:MAG: TolC family protein [Campylobacterota bacterium]|nr:TolC family protein [Campylobacterota bacterium]